MEDYKGITGDYADTNRDGKVDFAEYDSDCCDFEQIIIVLFCLQIPFLIIPAIILFIIWICQS